MVQIQGPAECREKKVSEREVRAGRKMDQWVDVRMKIQGLGRAGQGRAYHASARFEAKGLASKAKTKRG